jgi:oxygen-independent coproporphyrinogen III oxidase
MTVPNLAQPSTALTAYAYSYPHKSSYRPLSPPVPIADAWVDEDRSRLFLYVHIPFCEMKCGFCNLFSASQPGSALIESYLKALARQIRIISDLLPDASFSRLALGGGTPSYLTAGQLDQLLDRLEEDLGVSPRRIPTSVEASPVTADAARLDVLAEHGVERVSLGVQSFLDDEAHSIGRPQQVEHVYAALERIRRRNFPLLNIDLIYGIALQSRKRWTHSIREALRFHPEELYLYPLYVRPQTGLAKSYASAVQQRLDLYRAGREELLAHGYEQLSMRCFRRADLPDNGNPAYSCQWDGMVGLGCGARSYTRRLHYATRFAATRGAVQAILHDWIAQSDQDLRIATHGFRLSDDEQRRRFVIMSLLQTDGLDCREYAAEYGAEPWEHFPVLMQIEERGWTERRASVLRLSAAGMEQSDLVGPLLYSDTVRRNLEAFVRL